MNLVTGRYAAAAHAAAHGAAGGQGHDDGVPVVKRDKASYYAAAAARRSQGVGADNGLTGPTPKRDTAT